jgi:hypothetical protein
MKKIALSGKIGTGKFALVDDENYGYLSQFKWCVSPKGYVYRGTSRGGVKKTVYMHVEVLPSPEGMVTDHINHNKLDNRSRNLRAADHYTNQQNRRKRGCIQRRKYGNGYKYAGVLYYFGKRYYTEWTTSKRQVKIMLDALKIKYPVKQP